MVIAYAEDALPHDPAVGRRLERPLRTREYAGIEDAGLSVNDAVMHCASTVLAYRARPRNAIIARSTSTTCSAVSRPTRTWTFDLLTVVSLSIITSLS